LPAETINVRPSSVATATSVQLGTPSYSGGTADCRAARPRQGPTPAPFRPRRPRRLPACPRACLPQPSTPRPRGRPTSENYDGAPVDGSARTRDPRNGHVARGGSFGNRAQGLRSATRIRLLAGSRSNNTGLRVGRTIAP
jgi:hypothetical protein